MYQRKTPIEHVLLRPGMYIGSTERQEVDCWVYDAAQRRMARRSLPLCPGLLKLFDEILVNACDNLQRDPKGMTSVDVSIAPTASPGGALTVGVRNDGRGIPVVVHATEGLYVPELVFGHLLTGSNFGEAGGKAGASVGSGGAGAPAATAATPGTTTGGQHGYGAKLTNIFSTSFRVATLDSSRGLTYTQEWRDNMGVAGRPTVAPAPPGSTDYTTVTFQPDLARLGGGLDEGPRPPGHCPPPPLPGLAHLPL
jgi:DNA topoisomerase-2